MKSSTFFCLILCIIQFSSFAQTNLNWAKKFGKFGSYANGNSIATDFTGNVYSTGFFRGRVDFDPGSDTFHLFSIGGIGGLDDLYISKLDSSGNFVWARRIGSPSTTFNDYSFSVAIDATGNVYIAGAFANVVDFDPDTGTYNLTATGTTDIFILKLNSTGKFIWAKTMGGGSWDLGYSVHIDAMGNVYTTGVFRGTADFDPNGASYTMTSVGMDDVFVTKHDASGNFIWAKQLGGKGNETGYGITTDAALKVYLTGFYSDTADFNTGSGTTNLISNGGKDIFVTKLDTAGNLIWAKSMGGPGNDQANAIVIDPTNHVYTTGDFMNGVDFDPNAGVFNLIATGSSEMFISKLDTGGNFIWARAMGSGGVIGQSSKSITLDTAGNVYMTGWFVGTVDFDPGPVNYYLSSAGWTDKFISKLDKFGNFVWAHATGSTGRDYGQSIALNRAGNIFTTGSFGNTVDFDPGTPVFNLTSTGNGDDAFVSKLWNCVTAPVIITPSKNTNICPKDTVVLTASHAASYLWSTGATTRSIKVSTTTKLPC
jgi:hypothetical protein